MSWGNRWGVYFLRMAVVYFVLGVVLGVGMGVTKAFQFHSVHAHINLLGWVSMALAGTVYCLFPGAGDSRLGRWHFWLHSLGAPVMVVGLALMIAGNPAMEGLVKVGSLVTAVGILLFAINVFRHVKPATA